MKKKRKLAKFLNKEVEYHGVFKKVCDHKNRALILNVTHNGKEYADHVWVTRNPNLIILDEGTTVSFKAIAYMYNDKHNERKQGLSKCNSYQVVNKDYQKAIEEDNRNALARIERKYR